MKTIALTLVALTSLFVTTFAAQEITGTSSSINGKFHIVKENTSKYAIDYSNTLEDIDIEIKRENGETFFVVRADKFEVMYVAGENGFGLRSLPAKWRTIETNTYLLNLNAFKNQSLISANQLSKKEYLKLIAAYLPDVSN